MINKYCPSFNILNYAINAIKDATKLKSIKSIICDKSPQLSAPLHMAIIIGIVDYLILQIALIDILNFGLSLLRAYLILDHCDLVLVGILARGLERRPCSQGCKRHWLLALPIYNFLSSSVVFDEISLRVGGGCWVVLIVLVVCLQLHRLILGLKLSIFEAAPPAAVTHETTEQ